MKAGIIFTGTGPILILTTYESFDDPKLVAKLGAKGITKYIASELPLDRVKTTYGNHYQVVLEDLRKVRLSGERAVEFPSGGPLHPHLHGHRLFLVPRPCPLPLLGEESSQCAPPLTPDHPGSGHRHRPSLPVQPLRDVSFLFQHLPPSYPSDAALFDSRHLGEPLPF